MSIGQRISECLEHSGRTQAELARFLKTEQSTVSGWIKLGRSPNADRIVHICEFLGVSTNYLLTGKETSTSCSANNIHSSNVVQGNHAITLIVKNGEKTERVLSEQEVEILRIFNSANVKDQAKILTLVCEIDEKRNLENNQ